MWCSRQSCNSIRATEGIVLSYLYSLFQDNKSYSVINTHKAMLLQTLPLLGNDWCDKVPLITKFMKGIFNMKPPTPRYKDTWNVTPVLEHLKSLYPLDTLSLKELTLKVTALVALGCAPRAQTLASMDLDNMKTRKDDIVFVFPNLLKTSKKGKSFQLRLDHFADERLCLMHTVLFYIKYTKDIRKCSKLLISYVTHDKVTTSTIARWLKTVLTDSGIDTGVFKAHSYRSASVSAAADSGCSLDKILRTADWSGDKNFYKYYYRSSVNTSDTGKSFASAVLQV